MARKPKYIFRDEVDVFGNLVTLHSETWNDHILDPTDGHLEMTGYHPLVLQLLQDPHMVCPSTVDRCSLAYISDAGVGPRPEGVRVIVAFNSTDYLKGGIQGVVQTAYGVDVVKYGRPQIDLKNPVYKKK